jgi:hypothetical protein
MRLAVFALVLAATGLGAGCLNQLIPSHAPESASGSGGGTPIYDMEHSYAPDPVGDGGVPIRFSDIQTQLDTLGCTTSMCHGGTTQPVIVAKPTDNATALSNYYDILSGCADGMPDPADCIDTVAVDDSLLLAKTCATSGVTHMGGDPFKDGTDPTYMLWRAWIAAGAPY